ncbi:serine/threonine protein kinase [Intrasporangium calvum]|uniref:non-specific serine/threonine protein kinase n=1 Tax=Intrasporangium calvum TaxID=53358 RepID=A0ABT5GL36_9MICO|nr:serine/threonine-protein kinase [Intrasporangium calvum]MDC5698605.1 serine/threonine protein kinase [Intrasporangium calvum]
MSTWFRAGHVLGARYTLVAPIASGGMGDVWSATDDILGREVAVKIMRESRDPGFRDRFGDEARHSASLHHPNIAAVFDYGDDNDNPYLVMELVRGRPLSELIADSAGQGFDAATVRSIVGQAALALAAAHGSGVVHRDVKPANILVTPDGQAKLTDFGIARATEGKGRTITGEVLGTPEYLSPEQALGETATAASDLYSLGVIAHEMLTGAKPFDCGTPVATAVAQVNDAPPPLPPTVPEDLRAVVQACLVKDPGERPSDARALADALLDPMGRMPLSSAPTAVAPQPSPTRTLPIVAGEAAASAGLGSAADPAPPRSRAELRKRAERHTRERRRPSVAWLAIPFVALLIWGAFALGSLMGGSDPMATPQQKATSPALVSPTEGDSGTTTKPTTTRPTTATSSTTTTDDPTVTASAEPTESPTRPGKGNGRGKGNK